MKGTLFVCGTPIGNLDDITFRCIDTLKNVDLIAAEDTRQTVKLLNYYNIKTSLTSYHEHNKDVKGPKIISELNSGKNVAVVSDAGMPGISDPGEDLIKLCYEEDITVTIIPGPTAAVSAAVLSGIGVRSYCFEGFLPNNKKQRKSILARLSKETRTIVLYEAPHHLKNTLLELYSVLGNRDTAIVKELTKKYENVNRGKLEDIIRYYDENEPKGEFVVVIKGLDLNDLMEEEKTAFESLSIEEHMDSYLKKGIDFKNAMKYVARDRGVGKREIYSYLNKENKFYSDFKE